MARLLARITSISLLIFLVPAIASANRHEKSLEILAGFYTKKTQTLEKQRADLWKKLTDEILRELGLCLVKDKKIPELNLADLFTKETKTDDCDEIRKKRDEVTQAMQDKQNELKCLNEFHDDFMQPEMNEQHLNTLRKQVKKINAFEKHAPACSSYKGDWEAQLSNYDHDVRAAAKDQDKKIAEIVKTGAVEIRSPKSGVVE